MDNSRRCRTPHQQRQDRGAPAQILGNLVDTSTVARPASISHYNVQPMINVYAAVDGRDLGSVANEVTKLCG